MARGGRKRIVNAERYPSGGLKPRDEISPIVAKRMIIAAAAKMSDPQWSTVIGRYYLTGQLTQVQYEAAVKLGALSESYDRIMLGPRPPSGVEMERIRSAEVDPFSEAGEAEAERHKKISDAFEAARRSFGSQSSFEASRRLCAGLGTLPDSYEVFLQIRSGLDALAIIWRVASKRKI